MRYPTLVVSCTVLGCIVTALSPFNNPTDLGLQPTSAIAQTDPNTTYSLDWKLAEDEVLGYITALNPTDQPSIQLNIDEIFGDASIDTKLSEALETLSFPQSATLVSLLRPNERGNIDVKLIIQDIQLGDTTSDSEIAGSINELFQSMEGTVQLRGEVTPEGAIASFYLEQSQRNLIALFFELT